MGEWVAHLKFRELLGVPQTLTYWDNQQRN